MPQLDKVTFLSQFFWLCFFFLGFYFILLKYFLPKMSRILKLRKKKVFSSQEGINFLQQENQKIKFNFENTLTKGFRISRESFNNNFSQTNSWIQEKIKSTNYTYLKQLNQNFINSIGETSLSENIALSYSSITFPQKFLLLSTVTKLKTKPFFKNITINDKQQLNVDHTSVEKKLKKK